MSEELFKLSIPNGEKKDASAEREKKGNAKNTSNHPTISKKFLEGVVTVSLFALFFGSPLFFLNITFQGILFEKQLYFYFWLLIGLIAWAVQGVTSGTLRIRRTPLDIPIWVTWAGSLLLLFLSPDMWRSFLGAFVDPSRGFLALSAFILSYYFILSSANLKRLRMIFYAVVSSGSIAVIISAFTVFGIRLLPGWFPASIMGSFTALGIFLAGLLPFFITALFFRADLPSSRSSISKISDKVINGLLFFVLFGDLLVMFALYGYIPWVAVLLGLGVFLLFILSRIVRPNESFAWVPMVIFVGVLIILMLGGKIIIDRVNLPQELYPSYGLSWDIAQKALGENLFFGKGLALYGQAFSSYIPEYFFQTDFYQVRLEHAGGLFFETITTMGILGGIFLVGIFLVAAVVSMYFLSREQQRNKLFSLGVWSSAVIVSLGCLLTIAHGSILIIAVLFCSLAMAVIFSESDREDDYFELSVQASPKFALAMSFISLLLMVGVAFVFVLMGQVFVADIYAGTGARQEKISQDSIIQYDKAIRLSPKEGYYYLRKGRELLVLANQEVLKPEGERNVEAIKTYLLLAEANVVAGRNLLPQNTVAQENVAVVYDGLAFFDPTYIEKSKEEYEKLRAYEPNNPDVYLKLGQIEIASAQRTEDENEKKEKWNKAKEMFYKSLDLRSNYPVGHYYLAVVEELYGNEDEAISQMEKAVGKAGVTNNLSYTFALARLYQARDKEGDVDKAKELFQAILGVNDKEINSLLNLGALYESKGERDKAIENYQKALDILPEDAKDVRGQLEKFIQNVRDGKSNFSAQTPLPGESIPQVNQTPSQNLQAPQGTQNQIAPPVQNPAP